IPISDALPIIQDLMEGKNTSSDSAAYLGIIGQNITESNSRRFNIPVGVYVSEIAADSPAAKAGIKQGMVIVGLDGKEIKTTDNLMAVLGKLNAGDMVTVNVAVNRNGTYQTEDITVKLGSKSDAEENTSEKRSYDNAEGNEGGDMDPYGSGDDGFGFFGN
ncbi:MAG: PDZ domain-containing protein, partial [Clostridium sp.]|nr:PDZ domain-containing protein [Clostridium sp.]